MHAFDENCDDDLSFRIVLFTLMASDSAIDMKDNGQIDYKLTKGVTRLKWLVRCLLVACLLAVNTGLHAEITKNDLAYENQSVTDKINSLKEQVLELNRDLFILEEELLFPVNTQIKVFLSIDAGFLFELDSVRLKIDDKVVSNYLYTEREIQALHRGGVQQLYVGNLTTGEHELTAIFVGKGPSARDYKRASTISITKTDEAQFVELKIMANVSKEQPGFSVKVWE